ncbi:MAG: DUF4115 domain-containing protein [Anaerolineae bacterium]|nr:DUF4115 domain-containing protein [Anaerolineae bacterium]
MEAERLGQQLRNAREARELTLEEVEQALRIRARYLEAFEAGAYGDLPGAVQARGFLRNYARFLRLDEEAILAQFDVAWAAHGGGQGRSSVVRRGAPPATGPLSPVAPLAEHPFAVAAEAGRRRRSGIVFGTLIGIVALIGLCLGGTRLVERLLTAQADRAGTDLVSILPTMPSLTPSATFLPSPTPLPGARQMAGATPITDRVVLDVSVVQRTYLRVTVDGVEIFNGLVRPGTQLQYQAQQVLNLQASNGAGLEVVFNNLPLGPLGLRGEAIDTTFTPDLVLTPTPDLAPTATFTSSPTPVTDVTFATVEGTPDPALSGKAGQGAGAPTPLPLPDVARDVSGGATLTGVPSEPSPTLPVPGGIPTIAPSVTPTLTATPSPTLTLTATPSPTLTPSPTPILPPRLTSTPVPVKEP